MIKSAEGQVSFPEATSFYNIEAPTAISLWLITVVELLVNFYIVVSVFILYCGLAVAFILRTV